jgi:predicted site-specific integrase-resolvase
LGVARSTIQNWLSSGVLVRTAKRGVYRRTATTEERIKRVLRKRRR